MKANSWESDLLKHYFQNADVTNLGDATGIRGSTVAGSVFLSLHETYPGEAGSQTTGETAYTNYARVGVARNSTQWPTANPILNANAQSFPASGSAGPNNIYFVGIGRSVSGAGTLDYICPCGTELGEGTAKATTDTITIPGLSGVSALDEIAFFAPPKDALPAGITAGTIYFVKTVSGNDITISATSGGSTLDITADGGVLAWKMVKLAVTNGVTPQIGANQLAVKEE